MTDQLMMLIVVASIYYLVMLPFVLHATIQTQKRNQMQADGHVESAIERATNNMLADFLRYSLRWDLVVRNRGVAIIASLLGPILVALATAVILLIMLAEALWAGALSIGISLKKIAHKNPSS